MASASVVAAVEARLSANWTRCPVLGINEAFSTPADGSAFLSVQYPVANEEHVALGQVGERVFRESGGIRFVLTVPRGQGADVGLSWADELRSLFRAAQFDGVNCLAANPAFLDNTNDNGNYFKLSVVVEYYADILA